MVVTIKKICLFLLNSLNGAFIVYSVATTGNNLENISNESSEGILITGGKGEGRKTYTEMWGSESSTRIDST